MKATRAPLATALIIVATLLSQLARPALAAGAFVMSDGPAPSPVEATMRAILAAGGRCALSQSSVPAPRAGELLLRVAYSAINRADTLQRGGKYPPPPGASPVLGLEAAGVVVAHGEGVAAGALPVGARAMALLSGGGNAEYVAFPSAHALPVPASLSLREAAAVPEVFLTAFQLLFLVAHARKGESVIVHAAGSGVGTAAVQLAAARGLHVVAVAGADAKLARCRELGAAAVVNYKTSSDWSAEAKAATLGGRGADVILDPVGASFWKANADAIALDGRWVLFGSLGGTVVEGPLFAKLMQKRVQLLASTLRTRSDAYKAELVAAFAAEALPLIADGRAKPVIDREFLLEDAQLAHEYMETDANIGKILLKVGGEV